MTEAKPKKINKNPLNPKAKKNIDKERVLALVDKGLSAYDVAKLVDCTPQNIYQQMEKWKESFKSLDFYRSNKRSILDSLQYQILCSIDVNELKRMALRDRITAYGILYDKARIEAGEDIVRIDIRMLHGDLDELRRKKEELMAKLQTSAQTPPPQS